MLYYKTWISYDFKSNITYIPEIYHRYQKYIVWKKYLLSLLSNCVLLESRVSMLSFGWGGGIRLSASTTPQLLHLHGLLMVGLRIENQPLNSSSFVKKASCLRKIPIITENMSTFTYCILCSRFEWRKQIDYIVDILIGWLIWLIRCIKYTKYKMKSRYMTYKSQPSLIF